MELRKRFVTFFLCALVALMPIAVFAEGETPDASAWGETDFVLDGATITGFSEDGAAKVAENPNVVLPDKNGETAITAIANNAFTGTAIQTVQFPAGLESIGQAAFSNCKALTEVAIPETVTSLGNGVFTACNALSKITLTGNVKDIPQALCNTCALTELVIPEGVETIGNNAFTGNFGLISVSLPSTLTSIGNSAFGNAQLTELVIPASVKSIGNYAFRVNNASLQNTLTSLTLNEGLESIGNAAFGRSNLTEVTLPSTVTSINKNAFLNSTQTVKVYTENADLMVSDNPSGQMDIFLPVRTVTFDANGGTTDATSVQTTEKGKIPEMPVASKGDWYDFTGWATEDGTVITADSVIGKDMTLYAQYTMKEWGEDLFTFDGATITGFTDAGKARVEANPDVVLPDNNGETAITAIGASAFTGTAIQTVQFPAGLESIGQTAFSNCKALTEVTIPETVTSLGNGVFTACNALSKITLTGNVKDIPQALCNTCALTELVIPEGVETIGNNAFTGNFGLKSVSLPSTLTSIGNSAFGNAQLTELVIPASVKSIGNYAFRVNNAGLQNTLTSLTLNEGLESIGNAAFGRSSLTEVKLPSTVTSINKNAFLNSTQTVKVYTDNADLMASDNPDGQMDMILSPRTVTFDGNGGTPAVETAQTGDKGKLAELPTAEREHYHCTGWATAAEGGEAVTTDTFFAEDATVFGEWQEAAAYVTELVEDMPAVTAENREEVEKVLDEYNKLDDAEKASLSAETKARVEAAEAKLSAMDSATAADEAKQTAEAATAAAERSASAMVLAINIVEAKDVKTADYTDDTAEPFVAAIDAAAAVLKDSTSDKAAIDAAGAALAAAKDGLVEKTTQTLKVSNTTKTVKASVVKKAKKAVKPLTVKGAKTAVTYKKASGSGKLTVNSKTGKVTVKKGTKKGTYTIKIKVTAKGDGTYKAATKTVAVKVKVK